MPFPMMAHRNTTLETDVIKFPSNPNGRKIGIFGGSFNPAHEGHLHLSLTAIKALDLDEVWWLISPQNPLKPRDETVSIQQRLVQAQNIAKHPKIKFTYFEQYLKSKHTSHTISYLNSRAPNAHFVWLMGADNLSNISYWKNWQTIFNAIPIAVFDRSGKHLSSITSKAACYFKAHRKPNNSSQILALQTTPAWCFIRIKRINRSSSAIRHETSTRFNLNKS